MLPKNDGTIVLELRDIQLQKTWAIDELQRYCIPEDGSQGGEIDIEKLKQLAGISSDENSPSVQSLATMAFLYLLSHIYKEKMRSVVHLLDVVCINV